MAQKVLTYRLQLRVLVMAVVMVPMILCVCVWRIFIKGIRGFFYVKPRRHRPDILDDPKLGNHIFIRCKSGVRLHCVSSGPSDAPLMLFIHGFPHSWYSWRHQMREFSDKYRVVAVDLRGFGESDKPSGLDKYTLDVLADDISNTITALGFRRCILVGHDWGAVVAMATTTRYTHQVERLVIINHAHIAVLYQQMQESWRQAIKSFYICLLNIPILCSIILSAEDFRWLKTALVGYFIGAKRGTYSMDDMEAVKYYMSQNGTLHSALNHFRAAFCQRYINQYPLSSIYVPTLILWGECDFLFGKKLARMTKVRFVSNARLEFIEAAGHWVQEEYPEVVNDLIQEFLEDEDSNLYMEDDHLASLNTQTIEPAELVSEAGALKDINLAAHQEAFRKQLAQEYREQQAKLIRRQLSLDEVNIRRYHGRFSDMDGGTRPSRKRLWSVKSSHALLDLLGESDNEVDENHHSGRRDLDNSYYDSGAIFDGESIGETQSSVTGPTMYMDSDSTSEDDEEMFSAARSLEVVNVEVNSTYGDMHQTHSHKSTLSPRQIEGSYNNKCDMPDVKVSELETFSNKDADEQEKPDILYRIGVKENCDVTERMKMVFKDNMSTDSGGVSPYSMSPDSAKCNYQ